MTLSKHCTCILFSLCSSPIHTHSDDFFFVSEGIFDPNFKWIIWMLLQFRHGRCACNNELFNGMVKLEIVLKSRHPFALINNAKHCHIRGHLLSACFFNLTRMTQVGFHESSASNCSAGCFIFVLHGRYAYLRLDYELRWRGRKQWRFQDHKMDRHWNDSFLKRTLFLVGIQQLLQNIFTLHFGQE